MHRCLFDYDSILLLHSRVLERLCMYSNFHSSLPIKALHSQVGARALNCVAKFNSIYPSSLPYRVENDPRAFGLFEIENFTFVHDKTEHKAR